MLTCFILDSNTLTDPDSLIQLLPFGDSERCRLLSLGGEHRRRESIGSLVCLWRLTEHLGLDTHEIKRNGLGRPYFDMAGAPDFSLSHSEGICMAAITDILGNKVGADIEIIHTHERSEALASRFFTVDEQSELVIADDWERAFFEIWTRKEAAAKLSGTGLASLLCEGITPKLSYTQILNYADRAAAISVCSQCEGEQLEIFLNGEKI